ncbi:MAG: ankyrin repeat domain-containing protein [Clostridiales bacterium]|nr:ankyrin repeat domain-containing protein [Clostridiales bacterium]
MFTAIFTAVKTLLFYVVGIFLVLLRPLTMVIGMLAAVAYFTFMPVIDFFQIGNSAGRDLKYAIEADNRQAVVESIDSGADPNNFRDDGKWYNSPLAYAVKKDSVPIAIHTLLEYDIDPNLTDKSGETVFSRIVSNDTAFWALLPEADLRCVDKEGENVIDKLLDDYEKSDARKLKAVVEGGAVVTAENIEKAAGILEDETDETGQQEDSKLYEIYALRLLISNYEGEAPNIDSDLYNAFRGTFSDENKCDDFTALCGIAAACSADVLAENIDGETDTDYLARAAVICSNLDTTRYLVNSGAELGMKWGSGGFYQNAADYAAELGSMETVEYVISVNNENINECLKIAAENNDFEKVKFFIDKGADVNYKEAFYAAVGQNINPEIVKYFIENGCDIDCPDKYSLKYFVEMFSYCDGDTLRFAFEHSGGLTENEMRLAAYKSAEGGNLEGLLLLKEMEIESFNEPYAYTSGESSQCWPLYKAVEYGYFDIIKFLVENGATADGFWGSYVTFFNQNAEKSDDVYKYLIEKGIVSEEQEDEA